MLFSPSRLGRVALGLPLAALLLVPPAARGEEKKNVDGKYETADGAPSYDVKPDGSVDWYTFSGFRRYHSNCHVCHGPDGLGGSYAPNLTESLKTLTYEQFQNTVINGKRNISASENLVMPALGTDKNVYCYLDDIYIYLKARSDGAVDRGRPAKHEPVPGAAREYENQCMGG